MKRLTEWQERMGVGRRQPTNSGTMRVVPRIIEEGRNRGDVGGFQTEHKNGRVDATIFARPVGIHTTVRKVGEK